MKKKSLLSDEHMLLVVMGGPAILFLFVLWTTISKQPPLEITSSLSVSEFVFMFIQFSMFLAVILYTDETRRLREGADKREVREQKKDAVELTGYYGIDSPFTIQRIRDKIILPFRNYGKTPVEIKNSYKLIRRGDERGFLLEQDHTNQAVLNPNQTQHYHIPIPVNVWTEGLDNFNLLFEAEYKTYDDQMCVYNLKLWLQNPPLILNEEVKLTCPPKIGPVLKLVY